MANINFEMTANEGKAVQAFLAVSRAQKQAERGAKNLGRSQRGANQAMQKAKGLALGIAGGLGLGGGVAGAMSKVVELVEKWRAGMAAIARQTKQAANDAVALAMMQEGGKARERVMEATALGARYGVKQGESLNVVQSMQAQTGSWTAGKRAAEAVFRQVGRAGMPTEGALQAVSTGLGVGLTADQAARLPYAAGKASAKSPSELVGVAPAMLAYQEVKGGAGEAYGIAAKLSETIKSEKLEVFTRQAATALLKRSGQWGKFAGGLKGAEENDIYAMLQDLSDRGIKTGQQLESVGLKEIRQKTSLQALLVDVGSTRAMGAKVRGLAKQPGLIERERAAAERGFPELVYERESGQIEAELGGEGIPTTAAGQRTSLAAQKRAIRAKARALVLKRSGAVLSEEEREGGLPTDRAWGRGGGSMVYTRGEIRAEALAESQQAGGGVARDIENRMRREEVEAIIGPVFKRLDEAATQLKAAAEAQAKNNPSGESQLP